MEIRAGSDFSGVGAFDYAIERVAKKKGFHHKRVFACDMDKYARISYIANHGEPEYFPENVYDREIPKESIDIYMTSPPCQSFSLAGKRKGKDDERGILFFNSWEFIQKNNPRAFIFENVKGLLSDNKVNKDDEIGQTFKEWLTMLGGKSINGVPTLFPYERSVPYYVYWTVINSKDHGVPQNRERVFIVGIRDDEDNSFQWPRTEPLTKRLKDVLESEVDPKYFLTEKAIQGMLNHKNKHDERGNGFGFNLKSENDIATTISTKAGSRHTDNYIKSTNKGEGVKVKIVKLKRTEEAKKARSESLKTTGKDVGKFSQRKIELEDQTHSDTILANPNPVKDGLIAVMQMNPSKESGGKQPYQGNRVYNKEGISPTLSAQNGGKTQGSILINDDYCVPVLTPDRPNKRQNGRRFKEDGDPSFTITTQDRHGIFDGFTIRRLTPLECFRLQDFPDEHVYRAIEAGVSNSQLYKQAGNSITVRVLEKIIEKLIKKQP